MPAPETVTSRSNPLFKRLRRLKERGASLGFCLIEGPKLALEAARAGLEVVEAAATARAESSPAGAAALRELSARGTPVRRMSAELLGQLSGADSTQGLIALAKRPTFGIDEVLRGTPLVLVVDGVQDPGNLGALLRSAEAAAATGALLAEGSADPLAWKALRGSMGSAFRLPHVRLPLEAALEALEQRSVTVFATAADGDRRYDEADLRGPAAIVVGREGSGLSPLVQRRAAARLRIPLAPPVESLNVAVAAALVLFEARRQRTRDARGRSG
jgi:TrmH family RNA methyltransferase